MLLLTLIPDRIADDRRKQMAQRMYICENCKKTIGPNVPLIKKVVSKRTAFYPSRWMIKRKQKYEFASYPYGTEVPKQKNWICLDAGGKGQETIKEASLCPKCAE